MEDRIEYIGKFIYSENDVVFETVIVKSVTEAIEKLNDKSGWNNDRYELQVFVRIS